MSDEELQNKLTEVREEVKAEAEEIKPISTFQKILNGSSPTSS